MGAQQPLADRIEIAVTTSAGKVEDYEASHWAVDENGWLTIVLASSDASHQEQSIYPPGGFTKVTTYVTFKAVA